MRILLFNWRDLHHPAAGGAERFTWEVGRRLVAAGNELCWFVSRPRNLPSSDHYDGIEIVRAGNRLSVYHAARRFWQREGQHFDLVIDEVNTRPFLSPRFVRGVPLVAFIHQVCREVWFSELPWSVAAAGRHFFEPRWLASYRHVPTLTVSPSSAQSLDGYGLRLVTETGVGLSLPSELPSVPKEAHPTVVYVGRMASNKRPQHLLEAMRQVWQRLPEARLWMVGSGPLYNALRVQAAELLVDEALPPDRVVFFGRVSETEKFELMTRAWVMALASVREGWGLVVDEAAACGTPTVAYSVPGLTDSVPAALGTLTDPDPPSLGETLNGELLRRSALAGERVAGWRGGARSWDEVTLRLAEGVRVATGVSLLPTGARPLMRVS